MMTKSWEDYLTSLSQQEHGWKFHKVCTLITRWHETTILFYPINTVSVVIMILFYTVSITYVFHHGIIVLQLFIEVIDLNASIFQSGLCFVSHSMKSAGGVSKSVTPLISVSSYKQDSAQFKTNILSTSSRRRGY